MRKRRFLFLFSNDVINDPAEGQVTGCISGLSCNTTLSEATSVRVLTNEAGFGLGEYVVPGLELFNSWSVSAGCEVEPFSLFLSSDGNTSFGVAFFSADACIGLTNSSILIAGCTGQPKFEYVP